MNEDQLNNLYECVAIEISSNDVKEGLWLRAFSESNGDEKQTKAKYISLRVEELKRNVEVRNSDLEKKVRAQDLSKEDVKKALDQAERLGNWLMKKKI